MFYECQSASFPVTFVIAQRTHKSSSYEDSIGRYAWAQQHRLFPHLIELAMPTANCPIYQQRRALSPQHGTTPRLLGGLLIKIEPHPSGKNKMLLLSGMDAYSGLEFAFHTMLLPKISGIDLLNAFFTIMVNCLNSTAL